MKAAVFGEMDEERLCILPNATRSFQPTLRRVRQWPLVNVWKRLQNNEESLYKVLLLMMMMMMMTVTGHDSGYCTRHRSPLTLHRLKTIDFTEQMTSIIHVC
jgi:hypothetical protein